MKDKAKFALVLIVVAITVVALTGGCVKKQEDDSSSERPVRNGTTTVEKQEDDSSSERPDKNGTTTVEKQEGDSSSERPDKNGTTTVEKQEGDSSSGRLVKNITTIVERQTKTVDWFHENNKIAFGKWGMDGYVDVFIMNPDGSDKKCLTCNKPVCPQKHNGNPAWHPAGDYIVFTAEKEDNPKEYAQWAIPGSGFNCDLWVMTSDGEKFYQLTDYPLHMRGIIHPHFSHDGNQLLWAERLGKAEGSSWGEWALKVADFVIGADGPRLKNIKTYQPGKQHYFYESHAFSSDDNKILFCGNPDGQSDVGFDIYEMDLGTQELTNLTSSPDDWDEHAQYSPDGKKIAWISSTGFDIDFKSIEGHEWMKYLTTELWIMDADGSNKQRLTYFNEPGYAEYMDGKRCIVSDISWSPDGKRIITLVAYEGQGFAGLKAKIVIVELE